MNNPAGNYWNSCCCCWGSTGAVESEEGTPTTIIISSEIEDHSIPDASIHFFIG